MRLHQLIVTFVISALLTAPALARDYLRSSLPSKVYLASKIDGQPFYGIVGEKGKRPRWHIAQWGIRFEFPAITDCLGSCSDRTWQVQNADDSGRIRFTSSPQTGNVAELTQDTFGPRFISCDPAQEFDLFIVPTPVAGAVDNFPGFPAGLLAPSKRPSLAATSTLHVQIRQEIVSAIQGTRCDSPYNLASTVIGVVFLNDTVGQALFYQIVSFDSRGATVNGNWFMTEPPYYGVNDDVTIYGQSLLVLGASPV